MTREAEDFCAGDPLALRIHERVVEALDGLDDVETRISASQLAYRRGRIFALVWRPGRYLRSKVPLVLSLGLREPLRSDRFKEVVEVAPGTWMHHLELRAPAEVDDEVGSWIRLAWEEAAARPPACARRASAGVPGDQHGRGLDAGHRPSSGTSSRVGGTDGPA